MIPSFETVPEPWKHPIGPYRQAPAEFGGRWYMVNPFTGPEPWKNDTHVSQPEVLPPGFEPIFGRCPKGSDFRDAPNPSEAFRRATVEWEQELKYFRRAGPPEWASEHELELAAGVFSFWNMGAPHYFEGRYGFMCRLPESRLKSFDSPAYAAIKGTHHEVALYQIRMLQSGMVPEKQHPFVPPQLWPEGEATEE